MYSIHKIILSLLILTFSSCASNGSFFTSKAPDRDEITNSSFFTSGDPDGDGITKGQGYYVKQRTATGNKVFIFDPRHRSWAAYNGKGRLVNTGKASGGKSWCADIGRSCKTKAGTYQVVRKGSTECKSGKYPIKTNGGAPMPYCMHFGHKGYAIHASNDVPDDRNASHGCIRVTLKSAKWLNHDFIDVGTKVIIHPYE